MSVRCGWRLLMVFVLAVLCMPGAVWAVEDGRMQVFVPAGEEPDSLRKLHTNIGGAAQLALPRLWDRVIPQRERNAVSGKINALQFLQRATPTDSGVIVTFSKKRVLAYLKANGLPAIDEQPSLHLEIQLQNQSGQSMAQSASLLQMYAANAAVDWGVSLDGYGSSLVLQWRWLDQQQVNLIARGTSRLGEFSETRRLGAGDPVLQLREWLIEVLLRARDANVLPLEEPVAVVASDLGAPGIPGEQPALSETQEKHLLLTLERQASLAEQVLFEDELKRDPHVIALLLHRVNRDVQQYRLHLNDADDSWLVEWFNQRGMQLTPVVEGWVAR